MKVTMKCDVCGYRQPTRFLPRHAGKWCPVCNVPMVTRYDVAMWWLILPFWLVAKATMPILWLYGKITRTPMEWVRVRMSTSPQAWGGRPDVSVERVEQESQE